MESISYCNFLCFSLRLGSHAMRPQIPNLGPGWIETPDLRSYIFTPSTKVVKSVFGEGKGAFRFTFSVSNEGEGDIPEQLRSFTWGVKDQKGRD